MTANKFRCRLLGCSFAAENSEPVMRERALREHQALVHGIGRVRGDESHLGCFYKDCGFKTSGSARFTQDTLRDHLIAEHNIDPENPEIPVEARRGA